MFREVDGPVRGPVPADGPHRRTKARERKKYDDVQLADYTDEEIAAIEAAYDAESPRGAEPRWWEDVEEGDEVGPLVKAPHGHRHDLLARRDGHGPLRRQGPSPGAKNRARIPRFFHHDEHNIPDVMQRVHWDPEFAKRSGNPTTFDYGRMRETWLVHLCTDWMGDDAYSYGRSTASSGSSTTSATPSGSGAPWCAVSRRRRPAGGRPRHRCTTSAVK